MNHRGVVVTVITLATAGGCAVAFAESSEQTVAYGQVALSFATALGAAITIFLDEFAAQGLAASIALAALSHAAISYLELLVLKCHVREGHSALSTARLLALETWLIALSLLLWLLVAALSTLEFQLYFMGNSS